jgi:hypothetical protein
MKDSAFLLKTLGRKFVRDRVAVHTSLITEGVAFKSFANDLHSSDGAAGIVCFCIANVITSLATYVRPRRLL